MMFRTLLRLLLLWLAMTSTGHTAPAESFDFEGNVPLCNALATGRETNIINASDRSALVLTLYCDNVDAGKAEPTFLLNFLKQHQSFFDRVDGMFFSIGSISFTRALCQSIRTPFFHVRIFSRGDGWLGDLTSCLPEGEYQSLTKVVGVEDLKSFHPKYLALSSGGEGWIYVSSGNPSTRASTVLDFNLTIATPTDSVLFLWHQCVTRMFDAYLGGIGSATLNDRYKLCRLPPDPSQLVAPMLMPFDSDQYLSEVAFWAGKAKRIRIASQAYNSTPIMQIMKRAVLSGTTVQYLRDDDILLSLHRKELELGNKYEEYFAWDEQLCAPNTEVRFLLTKPEVSFLHAKFMIFEGDFGRTVIFGSGNATYSAIHQNIENNYVSTNPELNMHFSKYFDSLWQNYAMNQGNWEYFAKDIGPYRNLELIELDECRGKPAK